MAPEPGLAAMAARTSGRISVRRFMGVSARSSPSSAATSVGFCLRMPRYTSAAWA